jgi:hypothetical protein
MFLEVESGRCVRLTSLTPSVSKLCRQRVILNILQIYTRPRPVTSIALLFMFYHKINVILKDLCTTLQKS